VVVTSLPSIDAPGSDPLPSNVLYLGPLLEPPGPDAGWSPLWPAGDARPLVAVCLGTTPMGEQETLQRVLDAAGELDVRVLVTAGSHLHPEAFTVPDNAAMVRYVRHAAVLPGARLLVTHAGLGSVSAALTFAVPMVCMPLGREQPQNAARVAALGAGRVLPPTAAVAEIAGAIGTVLGDPDYRAAAGRVAAEIAAATADDAAARRLEALASR
jgi:MGT family glycosyltransferase